jgi:ABC-type multidrug transport system fused ATPase/permease subunit
MIGAFIALCTGVAILATSYFGIGKMDAGFAGLSLTYTLAFSEALLWIVRMNAMMEMGLNSVERVEEYLEIDQEEEDDDGGGHGGVVEDDDQLAVAAKVS